MTVNWNRLFNRLFEIIDSKGDSYFSGVRFISAVREIDPYFPDYSQYIGDRRAKGKSTSRKDYFYDIFLGFDEPDRVRVLNVILDKVKNIFPDKVAELIVELGGVSTIPPARIQSDSWNADRLNKYIADIDARIISGQYAGAVTLGYTCLEGFLKAFVRARIPDSIGVQEIIALSKTVRAHLKDTIEQYPDEALIMVSNIAHMVDRTRNRFSESHFDAEPGRWLAIFVRDLVNAEIRLLLHFM